MYQPIKYAEEGVVVSPVFPLTGISTPKLIGSSKSFIYFRKPYKAGSLFKAPMQAEVLRQIAAYCSNGFYRSDVTKDLVESLRVSEAIPLQFLKT